MFILVRGVMRLNQVGKMNREDAVKMCARGFVYTQCLRTLEAEAMRAERRHRGDILSSSVEV